MIHYGVTSGTVFNVLWSFFKNWRQGINIYLHVNTVIGLPFLNNNIAHCLHKEQKKDLKKKNLSYIIKSSLATVVV